MTPSEDDVPEQIEVPDQPLGVPAEHVDEDDPPPPGTPGIGEAEPPSSG